jgi:hypothetical protein
LPKIEIFLFLFWEEVCHILVVFSVQAIWIVFKKKPLSINAKSLMGYFPHDAIAKN